ncbi:hypothetical protein Pve01_94990 [Planomonospora venezuelensis]|nr:hypothetical protein Pve01_94990 [Planomonospora venezuelensis]
MRAELTVVVQAEAYVEASQPVTLPEHRWDMRLHVGRHRVALSGVIQGPQEYLGQGTSPMERVSGGRYGSIGSIVAIPSSGLLVAGSERIRLSLRSSLMCDDAPILMAMQRAQRVVLEVDLPIALSSRGARFSQSLKRARRRTMEQVGGATTYIDTRLGEFTHDGAPHPASYHGEYPCSVAGNEQTRTGVDPRALLGR